ncbi:ImmA/IrrE family metallo-endopeptidase [Streptococcus ferus]|uniref:ImmA/IrrE family metallo-endopeptidase n=1 Tax=Streptococcus ferus TaxID=1345 RepID=UPI00351474B3
MTLEQLIQEIETTGILILKTKLPKSKGRHDEINGQKVIFLDQDLTETEAINILLHEKQHCSNNDINNSLSHIPTYAHRIESQTEKNRILDFFSLINTEYPIDENFNYIDYMKAAYIPQHFENYVKKIAQKFYKENKKNKS